MDKVSRLPFVLVVVGALEAVLMLVAFIVVIPRLTVVYRGLGRDDTIVFMYVFSGVGIVNALAQAVYGFMLRRGYRYRQIGLTLLIIGAIVCAVVASMFAMSMMLAIYDSTARF